MYSSASRIYIKKIKIVQGSQYSNGWQCNKVQAVQSRVSVREKGRGHRGSSAGRQQLQKSRS